jgi:hypothetical protein
MGLFGLIKAATSRTAVSRDIVAQYQRFRPTRLRLNNKLVSRLSRDALNEGAKKLGILRGGMFVFETDDESCVLMDYCIYNVYRRGRNAVEQYVCDCPPDPDSDEMACLRAMQHATYALVAVLGVERGVGCHVRNLFTEETRLLVDMGFSKTGRPGTVVATRLLDFGDYVATSGAVLPLGILDGDELDERQRELCAAVGDYRSDPAPFIRACLERGLSSNVRYEGTTSQRRFEMGGGSPPVRTSAHRRGAAARRPASKAATNRRCSCGSGKMFKNCCGKG